VVSFSTVELHLSLSMYDVLRPLCKVSGIFVRFQSNLGFFRQILMKVSSIQLHENPSGGSRVGPCGKTDLWIDMWKLIGALCDYANAPKSCRKYCSLRSEIATAVILWIRVSLLCWASVPRRLDGTSASPIMLEKVKTLELALKPWLYLASGPATSHIT
jgi:hypothetical protein